ncbi:MAG: hypothetical protein M3Q29_14720 [Chloroflexota bacterium]|nr:hypothetical protein [Chloroflexota bacterium]
MEQNEIMKFLQEKASGADKEREQAAVNQLVGMMDPTQRQPTEASDPVRYLVNLTNKKLARQQQGGR